MKKLEMSGDEGDEDSKYLSPTEVREEIDKLLKSKDDILALELFLRIQVIGLKKGEHNGLEQGLLAEALTRLMEEGRRSWRRGYNAKTIIGKTVKSILSDRRTSADALAMNRAYTPAAENENQKDAAQKEEEQTALAKHYRIENAKDRLEEIYKLFEDDEIALQVLFAKYTWGQKPPEIQEELGLSPTEYASKLRKIKRRLLKMKTS